MNVVSTVVGYPYIGENREWKRTVEPFWKNQISEQQFEQQMKALRLQHIKRQQALGLDLITVGDFTYYDRMLDLAMMFNVIPNRYTHLRENESPLACYYAMARGAEQVVACEMTKWFNTNYHYIVPEYEGQQLYLTENRLVKYFLEAKEELGIITKPTLIGPYTFVDLSKGYDEKSRAAFIVALIPLYAKVIKELVEAGATWIQLEEPSLTKNLSIAEVQLVEEIYKQLNESVPEAKVMVQTYFEALTSYEKLAQLPVAGIGLDFVHGKKENLEALRKFGFPKDKVLSIGAVNGRDIWSANLAEMAIDVQAILVLSGISDVWLSTSCSLQHVPVTTVNERNLDQVLHNALAFADEKISEVVQISYFLQARQWAKEGIVAESIQSIEALATHPIRNNTRVENLMKSISPKDFSRLDNFEIRRELQKAALSLPDPTTTIGSFPQSAAVKNTRAAWRKKELSDEQYAAFVKEETARWIALQEKIGLDVLVHGEFERTDMVEYFGEKLTGFAFTEKAWVVSYGSRCVKPPIIYGDVEWTKPMTVKEVVDAQASTSKYVKGMLTGPVTILNWSFVRNDLPRESVAHQIALALRQEVEALEQSGIKIIQVDEPALREGLPLRKENWSSYLEWAVNAFKLATSKVANETQIHTHMCYCEFNDFIEPIRSLDADVISLETSRSHGELIAALKENPYALGIGLGVYDIHSPRVPEVREMERILQESLAVLSKEQFWVNPDCGLKTRQETETIAALTNMVKAAQLLRAASNESLVN